MASAIFHELLGFHSLKSEKITEHARISRWPMIYLSRLAQSARSLTRSHWFSLGKLIGGKELAIHRNRASVIVLRLPTKYFRAVRNSLLVFRKTNTREYREKNCQTRKESPSNNRLSPQNNGWSQTRSASVERVKSLERTFFYNIETCRTSFLNSDLNRNVLFTWLL